MGGKRPNVFDQLKWYGALLGMVILFLLARSLNAIVQWTSVLGFIVTIVGRLASASPARSAGPAASLASLLDHVCDELAVALGRQGDAEQRLRRLHDPLPLPVRWTSVDVTVVDHWRNIRRQPTVEPLSWWSISGNPL